MDFSPSPKAAELIARMEAFMRDHVLPAEAGYADELAGGADWRRWTPDPIMEALKERARREGLWNLFLPHRGLGAGLSNADYAPLAELTGPLAHRAGGVQLQCAGHRQHGGARALRLLEQKERWLMPLLAGEIRSAFCMTEPEVASATRPTCAPPPWSKA